MIGLPAHRYASLVAVLLTSALMAQQGFVLHDGTPLRLRLNRNLSSADAKIGDSADFEVLEDVKIDSTVVIARGATAIATITEAESKRRMARGGKLDINIDYVRLVNGDKVALRAVKEAKGGGHTGAMTGAIVATSLVFWPAAPFFLFMHGKDITIPKGTEITAYIAGEIPLDAAKFPGAAVTQQFTVSAGPETAARQSAASPLAGTSVKRMTNWDVISLKSAGLSDELVIAKIKTTPAGFQLDANDIIALRRSNVSEALIEAMIAATAPPNVAPPSQVTTAPPVAVPQSLSSAPASQANPQASAPTSPPRGSVLAKLKGTFGDDIDGRKPSSPQPQQTTPSVPSQFALNSVTITSTPAGARIFVDGYTAGLTPNVVKLASGTYKLRLEASGYETYTQQITVQPGQVASFAVVLNGSK